MATLEELKSKWNEHSIYAPGYDATSFVTIIRARVSKNLNASIHYFWASLALQILSYSMLSHVVIKYWGDPEVLFLGVSGFLLLIPFTTVLMSRFKKLASAKPLGMDGAGSSVYDYVLYQQHQLQDIYYFKKWYELALTPLSLAIGVFLIFKLYVPGGIAEHWTGSAVTFMLSLIACAIAIRSENEKSFRNPLRELQVIIDEFGHDPELSASN